MNYSYKTIESSGGDLKTLLKMSPYLALLVPDVNSIISIVAYEENVPIGLLTARLHGTTSLYITQIHVSQSHRRRGVASEFIKIIENVAKEKSLQTLSLIVNDKNLAALALYEKVGFVQKCVGGFWYKNII